GCPSADPPGAWAGWATPLARATRGPEAAWAPGSPGRREAPTWRGRTGSRARRVEASCAFGGLRDDGTAGGLPCTMAAPGREVQARVDRLRRASGSRSGRRGERVHDLDRPMSSGTEGGAEGEATARALGLGVLGAAAVAALGTVPVFGGLAVGLPIAAGALLCHAALTRRRSASRPLEAGIARAIATAAAAAGAGAFAAGFDLRSAGGVVA